MEIISTAGTPPPPEKVMWNLSGSTTSIVASCFGWPGLSIVSLARKLLTLAKFSMTAPSSPLAPDWPPDGFVAVAWAPEPPAAVGLVVSFFELPPQLTERASSTGARASRNQDLLRDNGHLHHRVTRW